jgi:hypothetical protein
MTCHKGWKTAQFVRKVRGEMFPAFQGKEKINTLT